MNKKLQSDWARVDAMTDDEIDTSDVPELDADFFAQATLRTPSVSQAGSLRVAVPIERDVLEWFKSQGSDYEERMAAALQIYAEAHMKVTSATPMS